MQLAIVPTCLKVISFIGTNASFFIRLSWLPMTIVALCGTWTSLKILPLMSELSSEDPERIAAVLGSAFIWVFIGLFIPVVMSAVVGAGILRFVVRGEDPTEGRIFHAAFDKPELRLMGVTSLIVLLLFLISVPLSLAVQVASSAIGSSAFNSAATLMMFLALLAISARWFLAYPVAMMSEKIDLSRAREISKPAYVKLVGVLVATIVPILMLDSVVGLALMPGDVDDIEALQQVMADNWVPLTLAEIVINTLLASVFFTTLGVFYSELVEDGGKGLRVVGN